MAKKENWEIVLTRTAEKVYDKADKDMKVRFEACFEDIEKNPFNGSNIKHLTGQLKGLSRYRTGEWRVIYRIAREKSKVEIIAILPRGDAYKKKG